jgi:hypothetical protein
MGPAGVNGEVNGVVKVLSGLRKAGTEGGDFRERKASGDVRESLEGSARSCDIR